ncbi:Protein Y92H12BR.7 [Aphelenchoides avenae]|nr:Protein Y92H12BR.7 [Aphelenchus avenae]
MWNQRHPWSPWDQHEAHFNPTPGGRALEARRGAMPYGGFRAPYARHFGPRMGPPVPWGGPPRPHGPLPRPPPVVPPTSGAGWCPPEEISIGTPSATGSMVAKPHLLTDAVKEDGLYEEPQRLYSDFNAPSEPHCVKIQVEPGAIKCGVLWTLPILPTATKYRQRLEIFEKDSGNLVEEVELGAHVTSHRWKTTPGSTYIIEVSIRDQNDEVVASGHADCKAVFSSDELEKLLEKATKFTGNVMHPFAHLYRCKPKLYWDDIYFRTDGVMEPYLKDSNGQAASRINGVLSGLFFSARTMPDGSLPPSSPFGELRMVLPAVTLLDPRRTNYYFADFYCNKITHYVTVVVCERKSLSDKYANFVRLTVWQGHI